MPGATLIRKKRRDKKKKKEGRKYRSTLCFRGKWWRCSGW